MAGVLAASGLLLAVAGVLKIRRPSSTAAAAARLPGGRLLGRPAAVRAIGGSEVVVAGLVLFVGGRLGAVALAVASLALLAVAALLVRTGADCGCFGTTPVSVGRGHLLLNAGVAAAALVAVVRPEPPLWRALEGQPAAGVPFLVLVGVLTGAAYLLLTVLPRLTAAAEVRP